MSGVCVYFIRIKPTIHVSVKDSDTSRNKDFCWTFILVNGIR